MSVNPNKPLETRFTHTLNQLLRRIERGLANAKTPREAIRLLERYAESPEYKEWCDSLALNITTQVNKGVSKTWREAAQKAGRGSEIYDRIRSELYNEKNYQFILKVKQNAALIRTFPLETAKALNEHVAEEAIRGRRSEDILRDLMRRYPETAKGRLTLIARTEVSKTQTALVQSRAQSLGLDWYVWRTSEDARVRTSHSDMEGVLVKWSDPPSPEALFPQDGVKPYGNYHAGDTFNCRCYPEPVVNIDYVDFPAKVYAGGSITSMTRKRFEEIA
ncbi:MAG: minor capsid protein [Clostridium sp.]|jgi:SPP1 gp7 family putative phage head morphogenesis protein|nr:minor capsid protein [Clostridium sp.]